MRSSTAPSVARLAPRRPPRLTTSPPSPLAADLLRAAARVLALGRTDAIANAVDYLNLIGDLHAHAAPQPLARVK